MIICFRGLEINSISMFAIPGFRWGSYPGSLVAERFVRPIAGDHNPGKNSGHMHSVRRAIHAQLVKADRARSCAEACQGAGTR